MSKSDQFRPIVLSRWSLSRIVLGLLVLASSQNGSTLNAAALQVPKKSAELFNPASIWTVHLKFTNDQWEAMEPAGGGGLFGGFGGPRPGAGAPRGDNLINTGRPGPGGFGPAMFIAPAFMTQGDQDKDGKLSKMEFANLGEKWFGEWDKDKKGTLNADQVRDGLNTGLMMPMPPAGGGNNGRPPRGMNLQGPDGKRNGLASAAGVEFKYVHADLEFEGTSLKDVSVRYKGNGTFMESRGSMKRSLKIDLNKNIKGQKIAEVGTINLANNITDATWMNEPLAFRLHRDSGVPAPRTGYARVYVTVTGKMDKKYLGLYSLVEDVDKHFIDENFGSKKGALLKPVTSDLFSDLGEDWTKYNQTYDPKTDLSKEEKQRIINLCKLVSKGSDQDFEAQIGDYLDLENFARYMAVTVWLSDMDGILGPGQNFYLHLHSTTKKLQFIAWDQDHSFGQFGMRGTPEQRENLSIDKPWQNENRFLQRIFKIEAFKKLYTARLTEFSKSVFKPERFAQQMDELAPILRPAIKEESEDLLKKFDLQVAGEPVAMRGFGGSRGGGFGGGMQPIKTVKAFSTVRTQSIIDQISGKSKGQELSPFGGFGGGPRRPGGPGGPGGFGPGMFLGGVFMSSLDSNKDQSVSHVEFTEGFSRWFQNWNKDKSGVLSDEDLRSGINKDLSPDLGGNLGG